MVLKIPIISTFNNRGIKAAEKDVASFSKTLKKFGLASKLSVAGVTASLGILAKQSIAAAIAEEKAVKSLSLTLKNLGIAAADKRVLEFIDRLQFATGVSEDQLRPAFQRLVTITRDVAKSQELLGLAMDISAGTGQSLDSVVRALGRAYNGNNTSLSRLGINLTKAELKTASFEEITAKLTKTFAGQAAQAADTFGGRMAKLGVAASEAKEIIGNSLNKSIDRFIANAGGIDQVTTSMLNFATATGKAVEAVGLLGSGVQTALPSKSFLQRLADNFAQFGASVSGFGQNFRPFAMGAGRQGAVDVLGGAARYSEDKRMSNRVKELKLALAIPKASAAELRNQRQIAANKKLAAKFDQENIAIEAALKGKLSDEDRARLIALKALKTETLADDEKALNNLNEIQKRNAAEELARIKEGETARSAAITKEKQERQALQEWLKSNPMTIYATSSVDGRAVTTPAGFGMPPAANASTLPATNASSSAPTSDLQYGSYGKTGDIVVNVNAGTIADENKLVYIIADQIVKYVRFGGTTAPAGFI